MKVKNHNLKLICMFGIIAIKSSSTVAETIASNGFFFLTSINTENQLAALAPNTGIIKTPCPAAPGRIQPHQGSGRCTGNLLTQVLLPTVGLTLFHNSTTGTRLLGVGKGFSHSLDEFVFLSPGKVHFVVRGDGTKIILKQGETGGWTAEDPLLATSEFLKTDTGIEERCYDGKRLKFEPAKNGDGYVLAEMSSRYGLLMTILRNEMNLVTEVKLPFGKLIRFEHNGLSLQYIRGFGGEEYHFTYDKLGRLTKITNPDDSQWNFNYQQKTSMIGRITQPDGLRTEFGYLLGGVLAGVLENGHFTQVSYSGNQVVLKDAFKEIKEGFVNGKIIKEEANGVVTQYKRTDSLERITEIIDGTGRKELFEYTGANPLPTKVTDSFGVVTANLYNEKFLLTKRTVQEGATVSFIEYDWNRYGVPILIGENGKLTSFNWSSNRLVVKSPTGNVLREIQFDAYGNISSDTDELGFTKKYTWNSGLLVSSLDHFGRATLYNYDNGNNLTAVSGAGITQTVDLNQMGDREGQSRVSFAAGGDASVDVGLIRQTEGVVSGFVKSFKVNGQVMSVEQLDLDLKVPGRIRSHKIQAPTGKWIDLLEE